MTDLVFSLESSLVMTESMTSGQEAPGSPPRHRQVSACRRGPAPHNRVGKEGDDISQVCEVIPSPTDKGVVATSIAFADRGRLTRFG